MRKLLLMSALLLSGCRTGLSGMTVVGSAYIESDRPEGKAVAKVEVHYDPSAAFKPAIAPPVLLPPADLLPKTKQSS